MGAGAPVLRILLFFSLGQLFIYITFAVTFTLRFILFDTERSSDVIFVHLVIKSNYLLVSELDP